MNQDQANLAFELAQESIRYKDFDRAERLLIKSIKLFQTDRAKVLLSRIDYLRNLKEEVKIPKPVEVQHEREFTQDNQQICQQVLSAKDYYSLLGVIKNCSQDDLKRAFKLQAKLVHPDKNAAPQATEAFKQLNAAMNCLSDPKRRIEYDEMLSEKNLNRNRNTYTTRNYQQNYRRPQPQE